MSQTSDIYNHLLSYQIKNNDPNTLFELIALQQQAICANITQIADIIAGGGGGTANSSYTVLLSSAATQNSDGIYNDWALAYTAVQAMPAFVIPRIIVSGDFTVPAGPYPFPNGVVFEGAAGFSTITFASGFSFGTTPIIVFRGCAATYSGLSGDVSPIVAAATGFASVEIYLEEYAYITDSGAGYAPFITAPANGVVRIYAFTGSFIDSSSNVTAATSPVLAMAGGTIEYYDQSGDGGVHFNSITDSGNASSHFYFNLIQVAIEAHYDLISQANPHWTAGTITRNVLTRSDLIGFAPGASGLTSTTAQAAIIEAYTKATAGYGLLPVDASTVALWYFNGGLTDSSGNGHTLTAVTPANVKYQAGMKGRKHLTLLTGTAFTSTDAALLFTGDATFEFVGKLTGTTGTEVLMTMGDSPYSWAIELFVGGNGPFITVYVGDAGLGNVAFSSTDAFPVDQLVHLAVTKTTTAGNTTIVMYANGISIGSVTQPATPQTPVGSFHFNGWTTDGFNIFDNTGKTEIHQAHLISRVLTPTEILARAKTVLPSNYTI